MWPDITKFYIYQFYIEFPLALLYIKVLLCMALYPDRMNSLSPVAVLGLWAFVVPVQVVECTSEAGPQSLALELVLGLLRRPGATWGTPRPLLGQQEALHLLGQLVAHPRWAADSPRCLQVSSSHHPAVVLHDALKHRYNEIRGVANGFQLPNIASISLQLTWYNELIVSSCWCCYIGVLLCSKNFLIYISIADDSVYQNKSCCRKTVA